MTQRATPYAGRLVAFATMHGKERLAAAPFEQHLGARVIAPPGLNTDELGTFAGDIPRTLSPLDAARTKARRGMERAGTRLGLASEGTFAGEFGPIHDTEVLLFLDDDLGIEIVESSTVISPLAGPRVITDTESGLAYAALVGFPEQAVIVSVAGASPAWYKDIRTLDELTTTLDTAFAGATDADAAEVLIQPDYRAHACPSRAQHLRELAARLAQRLGTPCPACGAPGWGQIATRRLPCRECGEPTNGFAPGPYGCGRCPHTTAPLGSVTTAGPEWCDACNP
ncbi:MAG TPA: DUF6671 family protein [Pseudolysinimonas sp.]|nr:DUF6671 family protein [Pseudolysinimonas sp.]